MTEQEAFDKVWDWFVVKGNGYAKTELGAFACAYRGANGTRCAIGVLIPNKAYAIGMEGKFAHDIFKYSARRYLEGLTEDFVDDLQQRHDKYRFEVDKPPFTDFIKGQLISFAEKYGLDVNHEVPAL